MTEAYEKRGILYFFQGKFDNVIQDFQTYIELSPPKFEAYRMLGMGYLKSGDYPSAIYNFTTCNRNRFKNRQTPIPIVQQLISSVAIITKLFWIQARP